MFAKKDKIRRVGFCDIPLVNKGGSDLCSCQSQQMSLYSIVVAWFRRKREQLTHLLRRNPSHKTEAANSANVRKSEILEESESRTSCGIVGAQSTPGLQTVRTSQPPPLADKGLLSILSGSCVVRREKHRALSACSAEGYISGFCKFCSLVWGDNCAQSECVRMGVRI